MKQPLSVIVPCKNESRNIGACIESFYSIADEIDSGSTDDTLLIAATYDKVRIIERDYHTSGDFKNWAIPQAANTWVLIVDADERIKPDLADEIVAEPRKSFLGAPAEVWRCQARLRASIVPSGSRSVRRSQ